MALPMQDNDFIKQLTRIADALERMANGGEPTAPDMRRPIDQYKNFDWSSIGASVVAQDADGAAMVEYAGTLWTRRSPQNKFAPAIWFSRASGGKDADGNVKYLKLITFQEIHDAEPLPRKAAELASKAPVQQPQSQPLPGTLKEDIKPFEGADRAAYMTWATSKTFNLPRETASWLLDKLSGDIAHVRKLIPAVAEAKAGGMDGKQVALLLGKCEYDATEFLVQVRNLTMHADK